MFEHLLLLITNITITDLFLCFFWGAIIGTCMTMTGVGGGVLIIPVLQLVFGLSPVTAVGTASIISALSRINATLAHIRSKNITWLPTIYLLIGAVPLTLITTHFIVTLSNHGDYSILINQLTHYLILFVMFASLLLMINKAIKYKKLLKKEDRSEKKSQVQKSRAQEQRNIIYNHTLRFKLKAIILGSGCGFVLGSTGIGGGILILPALNNGLAVDIKKSIGSSIVIALVLSIISAITYSKGGQSDIDIAMMLIIGSCLGNMIAIRLLNYLSDFMLYLMTIIILGLSLILTLLT